MMRTSEKILLIRFSSFGDIVQTLSVVAALKNRWPEAEIHWVTRSEFIPLLQEHPSLTKVWGLDKKSGLRGLLEIISQLKPLGFTHIYDAHNNFRSHLVSFLVRVPSLFSAQRSPLFIRRSIRRWKRFFLFRWRINLFEQPFSGQRDLLEPLVPWGISKIPPPAPQLFLSADTQGRIGRELNSLGVFVALAPSAAFPLKRWPLDHWKILLKQWLTANPQIHFVLLGGPEDHFISDLVTLDPERVHNYAGQWTLEESAAAIAHSQLLIANDTGLLHVGEQLGHPTIALMGPAPFGFPCRRETTTILELDLRCRPCSKHGQGPCRTQPYQWCLAGITPRQVFEAAKQRLEDNRESSPQC